VKERREKEPEKYEKIFAQSRELAGKAREALEIYDLSTLGQYMNENHELLQQIEVSSNDLDFLVEVARKNGALGAKMTGGGLGGYMVALTPGKELQEKVAKAIEQEGFEALRTSIGI
jgi:mevalonate kinase